MTIADAQRQIRTRFVGGFYGQLVSATIWLVSACLATWGSPRAGITGVIVGGFFIFPITELLIRMTGERTRLSAANTLRHLGMQVAFVLPLSMPLLAPVTLFRLDWFYPALMILVGAHYLPFVFLYGMPMFAVLSAALVAGGVALAMFGPPSFSAGAWLTAATLLVFAVVGRIIADREYRRVSASREVSADGAPWRG
jgi:hypothetical protein